MTNTENADLHWPNLWWSLARMLDSHPHPLAPVWRIPLFFHLKNETYRQPRRRSRTVRLWRLLEAFPSAVNAGEAAGRPLFVFPHSTPAHIGNLAPVWNEAVKAGLQPDLICYDRFNHALNLPESSRVFRLKQVFSFATRTERFRAIRESGVAVRRLTEDAPRYLPEWSRAVLNCRFDLRLELANAIVWDTALRKLLAALRPSCVVSTSDHLCFEHVLFQLANELGIPTYCIQHGLVGLHWWPTVTRKLLVWGDSFHEEMRAMGATPDRLAVCGMPASDALFQRYPSGVPQVKPQPVPTVLVLSQGCECLDPELYHAFKAYLAALFAASPSIRWLIKLHPGETGEHFKDVDESRFKNVAVLPRAIPLEEAVARADIACTLYSTAGLEAMIMRKPLLVLSVTPKIQEYAWWPKYGGGVYLPTASQMTDFLRAAFAERRLLDDQVARQDEFIEKMFAHRGKASAAIVELFTKPGAE